MSYNSQTTTLCIYAVLLHTTGVICTAVMPDAPPLEFPSEGTNVKTIQELYAPVVNFTNGSITRLQKFKNYFNDDVLKSSLQPINVIAEISKNYTENYIENKYYNNHIEESWLSITLTLMLLIIMAVIVLACSTLCLKKVQNSKTSKRQLLIEDCDESAMSDLVQVQVQHL